VIVLIFVVVVAFGVIMTFVNILRFSIPCKWLVTFHDSNK
jgi:hypothetical protein